jgi:hypothetical protein
LEPDRPFGAWIAGSASMTGSRVATLPSAMGEAKKSRGRRVKSKSRPFIFDRSERAHEPEQFRRNDAEHFAENTSRNLEFVSRSWEEGSKEVHLVTQIVISVLGLIVFPWEWAYRAKVVTEPTEPDLLARAGLPGIPVSASFEDDISDPKEQLLTHLYGEGWPRWTVFLGSTDTLGELVYHLRNAVSHRRIHFSSDSRNPAEVVIQFWDYQQGATDPYWSASITADQLAAFVSQFSNFLAETAK